MPIFKLTLTEITEAESEELQANPPAYMLILKVTDVSESCESVEKVADIVFKDLKFHLLRHEVQSRIMDN